MSIEDMISHIGNNELTKANDLFSELLNDKMQAAIDQEKVGIANTVFNGAEESEEDEDLDIEIDDEDLELDEDDDDYEFDDAESSDQ